MLNVYLGSVGAALAGDGDRSLSFGPHHPARAGAIALQLATDGDRIAAAQVRIGYEHRGAEKLFEVRDLRAALSLADRHDWQAPLFGELSVALSVESALGIVPSPRVTWLRTLAAEHSRIHAQLGQLAFVEGGAAPQVGAAREQLREQFAAWSGNRLHPMLTRIGGLSADVDAAWIAAERRIVAQCAALAAQLQARLDGCPAGVAVADPALIDGWGLSGPFARAAGLDRDLRRRAPALAWGELAVAAPARTAADARTRLAVAADDVAESARLIEAVADRLPDLDGPLETRLPKILRLPEGEFYTPLEAPWGEAGVRLVSRGEKTPWRVLLRTPSLADVQALEALLPGTRLEDLELVVASLGYVVGDVDK